MDDLAAYSLLQNEVELYLGFFKRRQDVELKYIQSLQKLSWRQHELDRRFNEEHDSQLPSTWRNAWLAIRGNLTEEILVHETLANRIDALVFSLTTFRDDKDRIKRRIKDDVKACSSEHQEYKTLVTNKLRRSYERKVEEVQAHEDCENGLREQEKESGYTARNSGQGAGIQAEKWIDSDTSDFPQRLRSSSFSRGDPHSPEWQSSTSLTCDGTSSQPTKFISGAMSAGSGSTYRDPPALKGSVFEAIAKRDWANDKHRVNSIVRAVGNLAQGNISPTLAAGANGKSNRARQVTASRLKKEAEQADRDYRTGICHLESLRLQRQHLTHSAAQSLTEFAVEMSYLLKKTFGEYLEDTIRLGHSVIAIAEHSKPELEKVQPSKEAEMYARKPEDHCSAEESPVYYINAFVGECRTLLFGVSLMDYHAKNPHHLVPLVVVKCIAKIDQIGVDIEGLYRMSGKVAAVQQLVHQAEKNEDSFQLDDADPTTVGGVLKLYLRQLPSPLFYFPTPDRCAFSAEFDKDPKGHLASLRRRIGRLDAPHQATLKALCDHLRRVVQHEARNRMTAANLAIIFTPVVFGGGDDLAQSYEIAMHQTKDVIFELLVVHHDILFESWQELPGSLSGSEQVGGRRARGFSLVSRNPPWENSGPGTASDRHGRNSAGALSRRSSVRGKTLPGQLKSKDTGVQRSEIAHSRTSSEKGGLSPSPESMNIAPGFSSKFRQSSHQSMSSPTGDSTESNASVAALPFTLHINEDSLSQAGRSVTDAHDGVSKISSHASSPGVHTVNENDFTANPPPLSAALGRVIAPLHGQGSSAPPRHSM